MRRGRSRAAFADSGEWHQQHPTNEQRPNEPRFFARGVLKIGQGQIVMVVDCRTGSRLEGKECLGVVLVGCFGELGASNRLAAEGSHQIDRNQEAYRCVEGRADQQEPRRPGTRLPAVGQGHQDSSDEDGTDRGQAGTLGFDRPAAVLAAI